MSEKLSNAIFLRYTTPMGFKQITARASGGILAAAGVVLGLALGLLGCGYRLQAGQSEYLARRGIYRVYLAATTNNTFKPGVEMILHNALIKMLVSRGSLRVVNDRAQADAELTSVVTDAGYGVSAQTLADSLGPTVLSSAVSRLPAPNRSSIDTANRPLGFIFMSVATQYSGVLSAHFELRRIKTSSVPAVPLLQKDLIWSGGASRAQSFPASNQWDIAGTTSALINDSEFDRVLRDLATQVVADAHDAMVAGF